MRTVIAPIRPPARSTPARCIRRSCRSDPGDCPICGMALEPADVTADAEDRTPSCRDMTRRFWIGARADRAGVRARRWRRTLAGPQLAAASCRTTSRLAAVRARDAGRAVGRVGRSSSAPRRSLRHAQPQHVHADRDRHRRRLRSTASSPCWCPACFRPPFRARWAVGRSTSRRPPSSLCWCCSARCSSCARATAPAARSARCSTWRRRRRAGSTRDGSERERAARAGRRSATGCACVRARRCRSTASCSRAQARSTNRWSPASRCRSRRRSGDAVIGGTDQRHRHASSCAPRRSAATRCWRRSCSWWPRRSAAVRRSSGWPTRSPAGSCRR